MKKKIVAYVRISHEEQQKEFEKNSNSIEYQIRIIDNYASSNGMILTDCYKDDGYSGTDFNRPGISRLLEDVKKGFIECILVKDLSRLGRNYIMTGYLIENYFPVYNVRFIAINDNVDTAEVLDELLPFKNIFNDWYAKDISVKIRSSKYAKAATGKRINSIPPYGYNCDATDKSFKLVPNEKQAKIVKMIYDMYYKENSISDIIIQLKNGRIKTPMACKKSYKYEVYGEKVYEWSKKTIYDILKREEYIGNTISLRRRRISYRNHKQINNDEDKILRFYNTHEAIIDVDLWNNVQKKIGSRK